MEGYRQRTLIVENGILSKMEQKVNVPKSDKNSTSSMRLEPLTSETEVSSSIARSKIKLHKDYIGVTSSTDAQRNLSWADIVKN